MSISKAERERRSNAERQRRYVAKLKARAAEPHSPDVVLEALAKLKRIHFPAGTAEHFANKVIAEAERISGTSREISGPVTNGKQLVGGSPEIRRTYIASLSKMDRGRRLTAVNDFAKRLMKAFPDLDIKVY